MTERQPGDEITLPEDEVVSGNTTHTRPENRAFYPALDGLRAVAFVMVFLEHYIHMPWGWAGVDVFFVLSGFLITGILFDSRDDRFRVRNFYLRRTLRIFPLYYGVLLLAFPFVFHSLSWRWLAWPAYLGNLLAMVHYVPHSATAHLVDAMPTVSLAHRSVEIYFGHFWSLCVEEQFYLIWPWVVFMIRDRRKLLWICGLSLPACLAMRLTGQKLLPEWMLHNAVLYKVTPFRLDALLLGGFLALWLRGKQAEACLQWARRASPVLLIVLFFWLQDHIHKPYPTWEYTWGLLLVDLTSALVLLLALQPKTIVYRVLNLRPLRWLGRISYGAYVWHDIPHQFYRGFVYTYISKHYLLPTAGLGFVSTCLLAWLSYKFFESRFLNLKERLTIREPAAEPAS